MINNNNKKTIWEPAKEIPVKYEVDVLVLGGGPAGFSTAVNAARQGVDVLLLEQSGMIGGQATSGLMSHWTGLTEGPFYDELLERCRDMDRDWNYCCEKILHGKRIINPEKTKSVMLEMLYEAGARVQLYTFVTDPIMQGSQIKGVITESKSGREAILAKVIVDATGDGDIAAKAGAPFVLGRESDGKMQPVTIMFKVGGVDYNRAVFPGEFDDNITIPAGKIQDIGQKILSHPTGHVLLYPSTLPGVVSVNMTNALNIDGTKVEDLTKGDYECRCQIDKIVDFLRKYIPGYEHCYVLISATMLGVRETRHFKGEYVITDKDIKNGKVFEDWIATRLHFTFDVHCLSGPGLDPSGNQSNFNEHPRYTLPYRCFIPKKVEGLYLCGRNISGTHLAHSNFRVMPICINMGHGVGVAAALAVKQGVFPRELNYKNIQAVLLSQGVCV